MTLCPFSLPVINLTRFFKVARQTALLCKFCVLPSTTYLMGCLMAWQIGSNRMGIFLPIATCCETFPYKRKLYWSEPFLCRNQWNTVTSVNNRIGQIKLRFTACVCRSIITTALPFSELTHICLLFLTEISVSLWCDFDIYLHSSKLATLHFTISYKEEILECRPKL